MRSLDIEPLPSVTATFIVHHLDLSITATGAFIPDQMTGYGAHHRRHG